MIDSEVNIPELVHSKNKRLSFIGRQMMMASVPASQLVETYLHTNEGRLQSLDGFPMKRAIYDNMPKKLLLKCSRKTLKSTLLSNMITLNAVRYNRYAQLYVAPQESSAKYFSGSYLSVRMDSPPLRKVTQGFLKNDVFEKVLNGSMSTTLIRYASDDATRVRGPATDHNYFDECLSRCSYVTYASGETVNILDVKQGDAILCFDANSNITTDRIKCLKPKGRRPTWRISLLGGQFLECTSNERILTNRGWIYLAQLLNTDEVNRCARARYISSINKAANATNTWNTTGGWCGVTQVRDDSISMQPWGQADGVCDSQGKDTEEPHTDASVHLSELRVRGEDVCLHHSDYSSVRILTQAMLQGRGEDSNAGMAKHTDLGGCSVLVHGRWKSGSECLDVSYGRISEGTSGPFGSLVNVHGCNGNDTASAKQEQTGSVLLHRSVNRQGYSCDAGQHSSVCDSLDAVQVEFVSKDLPSLSGTSSRPQGQVLSETGMSERSHLCCEASVGGEQQGHGSLQRIKSGNLQETEREEEGQPRVPCESSFAGTGTLRGEESQEERETRSSEGTNIVSIEYIGEQEVYDIETEKHHTFFANGIAVHNCQDMDPDILPIIWYTMGMSDFQRECYSGTPLTTDNTIEHLWKQSTQYEWGMRCPACNHWNFLRIENDPMKMIQRKGLCCSKCDTKLDSSVGEWIQFNTGADVEIAGYHLAQPILPYFSNNENRWAEIYKNVHLKDYGIAPIHNEIFGLSFDTGSKPITEEQLRSLCNLGPMLLPMPSEGTVPLHKRLAIVQKGKYQRFACGADWGVNMLTSRTAVCIIGIIDEMHFDVVYCEIIKGYEYEAHIRKIAGLANALNAFCASDAGPDPIRGLTLMEATSPTRTQLATYRETQMVQYTSNPGTDYRQARWVLHRSDTLSIVFNVLKGKKVYIRFPRWEDCAECFGDIMNVFVETKQGQYREEMRYSHKPDCPDDFIHALNFGLMQALLCTSNSLLQGQSSTSNNDTIAANV